MTGATAVITGGASGIGLGIARAFARHGSNIAIGDIRADALEAAVDDLSASGVIARGYTVDVSDATSVSRFAERVDADFGRIDVVVNNAGVAYPGIPIPDAPLGDISWVFAVNVFGVINGIQAFVPLMRKYGNGGHIVNISSLAGLVVMRGWHQGIYAASKMAVVALSEGLRDDVAGDGIGVSVVCPAAVRTNLYATSASEDVRPQRFGESIDRAPAAARAAVLERGLDPDSVGARVYAAVQDGTFYIITHPEMGDVVAARHSAIQAAFAHADATPAIQTL